MKRTVVIVCTLAACGGSDSKPTPDASTTACKDTGGDACFQLPTAPVTTRDGAPSATGCGEYVPHTAPAPLTVSGFVRAFGSGTAVPNASIKVYSSADFATPFATTTSGSDGSYSVQYPAGTPDLLFGEFEAAGYLAVYPHYVRGDLQNGDVTDYTLQVITSNVIEGAAVLVHEDWNPSYAVFAGTALDCNRMIIMHAAVVISSTQGSRTFIPGVSLYYAAPGAAPIAAPPQDRGDTNDNGAFAIFHLSPGAPVYVQMWGFVDANAQAQGEAGLTLLAEEPIHVVANTVGNVALWSR